MSEVIKINTELLANEFIAEMQKRKGLLKYHRRQFYYWNGSQFIPISDDDLKRYFSNFAESYFSELKEMGVPYKIDDDQILSDGVIDRVKAICHISEEVEHESLLSNTSSKGLYLATKSGILNLAKVPFASNNVIKNTPDFFNLRSVPHQIAWNIQPKTFLDFLEQILPNEDDRLMVQEIMGYCLFPSNKFQKTFIFVGEGSNGKSVLLLVLRILLGIKNISSVSLEAFDPAKTFALSTMIGKFANICADLDEMDSVAEGLLKQITSGDPVQVDIKFKSPVTWIPTTKLVCSTNILPHFRDKSAGTFRRILIIPFNREFAKHEQREELSTEEFWLNTGELPAILSWSLKGLERVLTNKGFTESESSKKAKSAHRVDTNPVRIYLNDNVIVSEGAELASCDLYENYVDWADKNGFRKMASTSFSKEVKRFFPIAVLSEHARVHHTKRTRFWTNIYYKPILEGKFDIRIVSGAEI